MGGKAERCQKVIVEHRQAITFFQKEFPKFPTSKTRMIEIYGV